MNSTFYMIKNYVPFNEQEEKDQQLMLSFIENCDDFLFRKNAIGHFSASAWIVNESHDKVLMAYHNIYRSFSWIGGHADGDERLLEVAKKEIEEETGLQHFTLLLQDIFSIEVLPVSGHIKNHAYVASHLHFNVTYLFEAKEKDPIRIKEDENSAIRWIPIADLADVVEEKWMFETIYSKLIKKAEIIHFIQHKPKVLNGFVGMEKISLVDYEGKVSTTLFTAGCNFCCPYCHNKDLIVPPSSMKTLSFAEIEDFINRRKDILDAIVITGGEPTLLPSFLDFLTSLRKTGLAIKIDTNGTRPEVLRKLIQKKLIDYVAMDIKTSFKRYGFFCKSSEFFVEKIKESIHLLLEGDIDYEFRTTLVEEFVNEEDICEIAAFVQGAKAYYLQKYVDREQCLQHHFHEVAKEKALQYQSLLQKKIKKVRLRGYE